ncbi:MAG: tRNA (cytidine(34)-2'-O)-methyltransferase [Alphaproteobacteria bacterium]|nr:tRNA (cytidine(34)-2'-O)-methyltransferase [Alphaproteobacteria bacterium]
MRIAMYQPDMPPSVGAMIRLCACFGLPLDIIEPCGFPMSDRALRRVAMDYLKLAEIHRHRSWPSFLAAPRPGRLILLSTAGAISHLDCRFEAGDTLLLGRESVGAPREVHEAADAVIAIPLAPGRRSLNIVVAAAIVLAEAMRQTDLFPRRDGAEP